MERPEPHSAIVVEFAEISRRLSIYCATPGAHDWITAEAPQFGVFFSAPIASPRGAAALYVQPNFDLYEVTAWLESYNQRHDTTSAAAPPPLQLPAAGDDALITAIRESLRTRAYDMERIGDLATAQRLRADASLDDAELLALYQTGEAPILARSSAPDVLDDLLEAASARLARSSRLP